VRKPAKKGKIIYSINYKISYIEGIVGRHNMSIVTLKELTKAIENKLDVNGEEARRYANVVMDLFGYDDCIIDNILEHRDRRLFYRLESEGFLDTRRDEVLLTNGKNWRIHYWVLQKAAIFQYLKEKTGRNTRLKIRDAPTCRGTIYSSLPEGVWAARKSLFV
jgi:hypothetical protein